MLRFILCCLLGLLVCSQIEVDVSWKFDTNDDTSGWGNATSAQSDIIISAKNGNLVCSIVGSSPVLDSPSLFLEVSTRHFVVLRMSYLGVATTANLLLRSSASPNSAQQLAFNTQYWTARQRMSIVPGTNSAAQTLAIDGNPNTIYKSTSTSAVEMIIDLGDFRQITGLRLLPGGGTTSPKRCYLQQSLTTGIGPFQTVVTFTGDLWSGPTADNPTIPEKKVSSFTGYARYWKLIMLDNYGGSSIDVREFNLDGYDDTVTAVPFALVNTGVFSTYYLPINTYLNGMLTRMRLAPQYGASVSSNIRETMLIDQINVIRSPLIYQVRGCLDQYYLTPNYLSPEYNVTSLVNVINNNLPLHYFAPNDMPAYQYATTYNCPLTGGVVISVTGINFGSKPNVYINNQTCPFINVTTSATNGRLQTVNCMLPNALVNTIGLNNYTRNPVKVRVENSVWPGLFYEIASLQYGVAPPVPVQPVVTNIGANRVDLTWSPPGSPINHMSVTGYKIMWFQPKFRSMASNLTVGNVTVTSIRGLEPATEYVFAIAAVNEGIGSANLPTDLYGRRNLQPNALIGEFSIFTNISATLLFDFDFSFFSANNTLNASSSSIQNDLGPTGQFGAEGAYGLVIVGSANVQNCNVSSTCCDGYNATQGISSCGTNPSVCAVLPARMLAYDYVIGGITRRTVPTNLPYSNGAPPEINILTLAELIANKGADLPSSACGPALRLTNSEARQSGSAWYRRKMDVREGFDTHIKFQISNPSQKCDRLDDVNTYCRSRGADGFAFVLQNAAPDALGNAGSGLGYEGIFNSLAVEMDTYHNFDQMDYYENHISVMTEGWRFNITANHSRSLATTNRIPDLTDGIHTVRIKYDPNFDENAVPHPSFQVNGFTTWFMNNGDFANGGEGDWGTGFGLLYVYLDDMYSPVITTPLNLGKTLKLDNGRAYVGLTAATGNQYWQAHDIHSWQFSSLHIDEKYTPPLNINNQGAHKCVNETVCVNRVDYDHYMRTNNVWGKSADSTEGWQSGSEGYCAFC